MKTINEDKLITVKGGGINWGLWSGIGGVVSFVIGLIDGFVHPKKCSC